MKEKKKKKIQIWFKFIYVDIENIEEYKGKTAENLLLNFHRVDLPNYALV